MCALIVLTKRRPKMIVVENGSIFLSATFSLKKKSNCKNSLRERLCMYYLSWPSPPQLLHSIQKLIHRQRHIFLFKRSWNNSCCFEQVKNHISIKETKRSEQTPSTNILFLCNSTLFTLQIVTFFT